MVHTPQKIQVGIGFLRNTGIYPLKKELDPMGVQLLLEGGTYGPL